MASNTWHLTARRHHNGPMVSDGRSTTSSMSSFGIIWIVPSAIAEPSEVSITCADDVTSDMLPSTI